MHTGMRMCVCSEQLGDGTSCSPTPYSLSAAVPLGGLRGQQHCGMLLPRPGFRNEADKAALGGSGAAGESAATSLSKINLACSLFLFSHSLFSPAARSARDRAGARSGLRGAALELDTHVPGLEPI